MMPVKKLLATPVVTSMFLVRSFTAHAVVGTQFSRGVMLSLIFCY